VPLTKDAHTHPHALSGMRQRARCPIQYTKEPYREVNCANWQWPERKKTGDRARTTRDETVSTSIMCFWPHVPLSRQRRRLTHKFRFIVSGHCRYATALHGRQLSLVQMEDAYRGVERGQRTRSSINSRSIFRPPRFLRNLTTYRGRVVRKLLSHYNNDPLQQHQVSV
jgi:hypothetical protein